MASVRTGLAQFEWLDGQQPSGFSRCELGKVRGATFFHRSRGYQAFVPVGERRAAGRSLDASTCSLCIVACSGAARRPERGGEIVDAVGSPSYPNQRSRMYSP